MEGRIEFLEGGRETNQCLLIEAGLHKNSRVGGEMIKNITGRRCFIKFVIITSLVLLFANSTEAQTNISNCIEISSQGEYVLNSNLTNSTTCIKITSNDVIFDGAGYRINGTGWINGTTGKLDTKGISVENSLTNVTVKNITLTNWYYGIYVISSSNISLSGNNASNNFEGISLAFSSNNMLIGNNASNNFRGIYLASSNNNTLIDNNASNNFEGIYLAYSSNNNTLSGNNASYNYNGIHLYQSSNNNLSGNNASYNFEQGIYLSYSSNNNTLIGNNASNNFEGIYLVSSRNNTLSGNNMSENVYNFDLEGCAIEQQINEDTSPNTSPDPYFPIPPYNTFATYNSQPSSCSILDDYIQKIDTTNRVDGKPIYYWVDEKNKQISDDAGYVGIVNSTNITVKDLTLNYNGQGILFVSTDNSMIENVSISSNYVGIYLASSNNNTLSGNNASSNYSIALYNSNNNTLHDNKVLNKYDRIYLFSSSHNKLTGNDASINLSSSSYNTLTGNNAPIYLSFSSDSNMLSSNNASINLSTSSGNTLSDNNASNSYEYGIYLFSSNDSTLIRNNASNNYKGIYLASSNNNTLIDNNMLENVYNFGVTGETPDDYMHTINTTNKVNGKPIYYWVNEKDRQIPNDAGYVGIVKSTNITVKDLTLKNNGQGILFVSSNNNTLSGNNMSENEYNFDVIGEYNHTIDTTNKVDGKPIYYWINEKDRQIPNDAGYVGIVNSTNITVKDLTLKNNGQGILFVRTNNSRIENVSISNTSTGIYLFSSSDNMLSGNNASNNALWDFYSKSNSLNNTVINLTINPTISFTGKDIAIKSVSSPNIDPIGLKNMSIYLNAISNSDDDSWLFLNVSYGNSNVTIENESLLRFWRYAKAEASFWMVPEQNGTDTVQKYVYANITGFGIFAPMFPSQYSFNWDEVPGNDTKSFINFLKYYCSCDWVETATINKTEEFKIVVYDEKYYVDVSLQDVQELPGKVIRITYDGINQKISVITVDGKLIPVYATATGPGQLLKPHSYRASSYTGPGEAGNGGTYTGTGSAGSYGDGGGGGGGGGGTSGENYTNIEVRENYYETIFKDKVTSYRFTNKSNPVLFINITGNVNAGLINTMVEVLRDTSTLIKPKTSAPGIVYKNINIWVGTTGFAVPENIKEAVIRFRVENTWLSDNNVTSTEVKLVKWDGSKWITLETSEKMKDSTNTYLEGKTDSFSSFAITGMKETVQMAIPTATITSPEPTLTVTTGMPEAKPSMNWALIIGVLSLIAIMAVLYMLYLKRK